MRTAAGLLTIFFLGACVYAPFEVQKPSTEFPRAIARVISADCAVQGCHNTRSKEAAAGLDLTNWKTLFEGGRNNSVIIPFSPDQSPLLFVINTDSSLASTLLPTMPINGNELNDADVRLVYDWIAEGAPNKNGETPFENIGQEDHLVVLNSLCSEAATIDLSSGLLMRYADVEQEGELGFPTKVFFHENSWCVLFTKGHVRCFDAASGMPTSQFDLPQGTWRTISASNEAFIAVDWSGNSRFGGGRMATINLEDGAIQTHSFREDSVYFPIGWTGNSEVGYFTAGYLSNAVYHIDLGNGDKTINKLLLNAQPFDPQHGKLRPSSLVLSSDNQHLYVGCERTGELRKINLNEKKLESVIPVGYFPQEMLLDRSRSLLFVSCTEDLETFPGKKGSVYCIDLSTDQVVHKWYTGYQPKAMALDEERKFLYIANRNVDPVGADEPHHYTDCEGRNGYITRIDLTAMQLDPNYKAEVSVDPYSMALSPF